ncbi:MAG: enoyl-CoA hydratase-related protein, partial [Porticoccaceae bacterium]|nr:enoyl-CoA hydratase-related protein [Porticoccaceae bacterium]
MFSGQTLTLKMIENDFAEINFNNLTGSVNKFDQQTLGELETAVGMLKGASSIEGLLVSSSKSVFVVGADITEFSAMFSVSKESFIAGAQHANGLFSAIEDLPYPSVAAINGFALGGGLEVGLACDSRVMNTKSAIGLPETGLGIIPGWGGTVRLPRLVGFATAAQWISSGAQQSAQAALEAGAVDQLAEPEDVRNAALALLTSHANGEVDFEERRISKRSAVNVSSAEIAETADKLQSAILGRTGNKYPAPLKVIDLLSTAALLDRDAAIHLENQSFYELSHTAEARA